MILLSILSDAILILSPILPDAIPTAYIFFKKNHLLFFNVPGLQAELYPNMLASVGAFVNSITTNCTFLLFWVSVILHVSTLLLFKSLVITAW